MSRSPFIASGSRRRRETARRRRRRRVLASSGILLAAAAIAAAVVALLPAATSRVDTAPLAGGGHARGANHSRVAGASGSPAPPAAPTTTGPPRSALGLPLGRPPLQLALTVPDAVHLPFHHPARSGLLFNLQTGRVLWQRDALARVPIASLTKMMTALVVSERTRPGDRVLITPQALAYQGSGVGVLPRGKRVPLEALLGGLLLPSGNDAAIALAQRVSGTVPRFVTLMNDEAARLGLGCTRFASPSGIVDRDNYSCAADLAVLAAADLAQPRVASFTRRASVVVPFPIKGGKLFLYNNNPLVRLGFPGITGLKTGYTLAAGRCLVATAQRSGIRLGVVLLNSPDPATQARQLLDRGFQGVYHQRPVPEPLIPPVPVPPTAGRGVSGARRGG